MAKVLPDHQTYFHGHTSTEQPRLLPVKVSFWVLGILNYATFLALLSGAQDILAGSVLQTSTVLMSAIVPYCIVVFFAPYFVKSIPYVLRFSVVFLIYATSFLVLGIVHGVKWKLSAMVIMSFGMGIADMSMVALTSYFTNASVLSAYSTGTGAGLVIGALYYTGKN